MNNKLSTPLLATLFAIITITNAACTRKLSMQSDTKTDFTGVAQIKDPADSIYLNEINTKVLRSFYKTYGELPGAKWRKSANGFLVTFKNNGISNIVYYKRNGLVDCEILSYFEDRLPRQVRHFVKSRFYDYTISHITEVHKSGVTAFYVKVEDASAIKTLKIVGEEWEVVQTLVKR